MSNQRIKFLQDTEVEIIESVDFEGEIESQVTEIFSKGEEVDVDFLMESDGICEMEFGDGSVCFLEKSDFSFVNKNEIQRRAVRVHTETGDYFETEINGTEESIREYYEGKTFSMGYCPVNDDRLEKCVRVEFID